METQTTTTVIYHRADFDGIFCREIARKFLPGAELIGWDYGDPLVPMPSGQFYILDLSPECVEGLTACGGLVHPEAQRLIWIDHHKSAIEKFPAAVPGYRIDGVAACRLAWQWFTTAGTPQLPDKSWYTERKLAEPKGVRLAGEYDIWDKRDPDAETFQFGLRSRELTAIDWEELLSLDGAGHVLWLLKDGHALQRYQRERDASVVKRAFDVEFEGLKFLALNIAMCNSLTFEAAARPEHDGLMGFYWTGKEWSVSLYHTPHRKDHDLSQIAGRYGGGGHRGACGFRTPTLPFVR